MLSPPEKVCLLLLLLFLACLLAHFGTSHPSSEKKTKQVNALHL